jgi:hypothetical protein
MVAGSQMRTAVTYQLGECRFVLHTEQTAHHREVAEFLPWVSSDVRPRRAYELLVVSDPARKERLTERCQALPAVSFPAFAGEEQWAATISGPPLYWCPGDPDRGVIARDGERYTILADDRLPDRLPLRLLRELYIRDAEEHALMIHAAAFVRHGCAQLLVGPKGAGKTTLLFACLEDPDSAVLANDRVVVTPELDAFPFPRLFRLGLGTVGALPRLRPLLNDLSAVRREQHPDVLQGADAFGSEAKLELSPADVVRALGVEHSAGAPLGGIVLPHLEQGTARVELETVGAAKLRQELQAESLLPSLEQWNHPWLTERQESFDAMRQRVARLLDRIAALPAKRLRFGTEAPAEAVRSAMAEAMAAVGA